MTAWAVVDVSAEVMARPAGRSQVRAVLRSELDKHRHPWDSAITTYRIKPTGQRRRPFRVWAFR